MFVVQNVLRPAEIQNALVDLLRDGVASVRVCSAYMSRSGSGILLDAISRAAQDGRHDQIQKTVVTSLDFGITEPSALEFWMHAPNCAVLVAGTSGLQAGRLIPRAAFHPKFYVVGRPN